MRQPYVQDSSSNGTWLNGTRLIGNALHNLQEGDRIELAAEENGKASSVVFRFILHGSSPISGGQPELASTHKAVLQKRGGEAVLPSSGEDIASTSPWKRSRQRCSTANEPPILPHPDQGCPSAVACDLMTAPRVVPSADCSSCSSVAASSSLSHSASLATAKPACAQLPSVHSTATCGSQPPLPHGEDASSMAAAERTPVTESTLTVQVEALRSALAQVGGVSSTPARPTLPLLAAPHPSKRPSPICSLLPLLTWQAHEDLRLMETSLIAERGEAQKAVLHAGEKAVQVQAELSLQVNAAPYYLLLTYLLLISCY